VCVCIYPYVHTVLMHVCRDGTNINTNTSYNTNKNTNKSVAVVGGNLVDICADCCFGCGVVFLYLGAQPPKVCTQVKWVISTKR
jgi:hypothetical protein